MNHGDRGSQDAAGSNRNRLARESSPYLLLHQHNPVDWYPWGEEAIATARRENRPIFLSVGYSTCYWCHVMERESFSDPEIAALLNRSFVNIKVDREERPDLDEIYMAATQLLTGQGGWPNSVFMTPELEPFYAGTYFPPRERYGRPGFATLILALADAWKNRREQIDSQAEEVATALSRYLEESFPPAPVPPGPETAWRSFEGLKQRFDPLCGGFSDAPKFPTPSNLFLLQELAPENADAARLLEKTLDEMARGGLFDQLGGGFHRYSTDREWRVPHFEKMLYDNGLLLELYAREHQRTGSAEAARVCGETVAFLLAEMAAPEGGFWSAIDAETGGHEGAFYAWTRPELEAALGEEDAHFFAPLLGFAGAPFFEGEHYVLHRPRPIAEEASARRMSPEALLAETEPLRRRLLAERNRRPRPATDDKVLTDWNGLAIAGLAVAGKALGEPAWVERARAAGEFVWKELRPSGGPLLHVWRGGSARLPAFLADYVFLVHGFLALAKAGAGGEWIARAQELAAEQEKRLGDSRGAFFTAAASEELLFRTREVFDGALPSANAVAVLNLLDLARLTGEASYLQEAERALCAFAHQIERFPEGARMLALAARRAHELGEGGHGGPPLRPETERERERQGQAPRPSEDGLQPRTGGPPWPPSGGTLGELEREALEVVRPHLEPFAGAPTRLRLRLVIAPGWHLQAQPASEPFLVPTTLEAEHGLELTSVSYPEGKLWNLGGSEIRVYQGEVVLEAELAASPQPGAALRLSYQACNEQRCLPPLARLLAIES
ncbi:MAG: DUF255 domain-containing protein [Thermoanaerobaculia bacterium]